MRLIQLMLIFISVSLFARSNYCIQVTTIYDFNKYDIPRDIKNILDNFDKARIDKRNGRLVLRVGDYREYNDGIDDLDRIQEIYYDAYLRKCDYIKSKVIYEKKSYKNVSLSDGYKMDGDYSSSYNKDDDDILYSEYDSLDSSHNTRKKESSHRRRDTKPHRESSVVQYSGQDRENYDLYRECQKCFAPIQEDYTPRKHQSRGKNRREIYNDDTDFDDADSYDYNEHIRDKEPREENQKEDGGFLSFLKKPKDVYSKEVEQEKKKKEGFFNYLRENKYEDDDIQEEQHKKKDEDSGFFGYIKKVKNKISSDDEYDKEIDSHSNDENGYDMYDDDVEKPHKQERRRPRFYNDDSQEDSRYATPNRNYKSRNEEDDY